MPGGGIAPFWGSADLPDKVSRDTGYCSDSITISCDMGPLSFRSPPPKKTPRFLQRLTQAIPAEGVSLECCLDSQQSSPNVKTLCYFEPQIWPEIVPHHVNAKSACLGNGSGILFREYCFGEESSLSLTEFYGKLGEFCEKTR